jgi:hypothetical protein
LPHTPSAAPQLERVAPHFVIVESVDVSTHMRVTPPAPSLRLSAQARPHEFSSAKAMTANSTVQRSSRFRRTLGARGPP